MKPEQVEKIMELNCTTNPDRVKEIARVVYELHNEQAPTKYQIQDAYRYLEGGDCFRKLEEEFVIDNLAKLPMRDIVNGCELSSTKVKVIALKKNVSIRQAQRLVLKYRQRYESAVLK